MIRVLALIPLLVLGCTRGSTVDDTAPGVDNGLGNPLDGLEPSQSCEEFEQDGCRIGVATGIFAGDYVFGSNDTVSGFEYWWLYPNSLLAEQSDDWELDTPCTMVWEIFADQVIEDRECAGCAYQLVGSANFRVDASDCPAGLEDAEGGNFDFNYDVREDGDGVRLFFHSSGTEFGAGESNNQGIVWQSDAQCEAFGSSEEGCTRR